ncbi:MAG: C25 family cysteine peptidase [Bacteroidales bacterium]|nr:C25 family cysteine peptidase [Bacteroidales bacterium]
MRTSAKNTKSTENSQFFSNIISEMEVEKITVQGQNFTTLQLDGYVFHGEIGHPKLPAKTQLLEIPTGSKIEIKILSSEFLDIPLDERGYKNQLLPVQPPVRKSAKNIPALAKNESVYRENSFTLRTLADVQHLGIMKDRQLAQLNICPIQYLPSENKIRVYYFIEFEINFIENQPQTKTRSAKSTSIPKIYKIISDRKFETTLEPFVNWKTEKGFDVRVAYTDQPEVGHTTTSIKNYLRGIYESTNRADYLLLVGDTDEIPSFPVSVVVIEGELDNYITDLYYAEYTGDNLPDVFYGRLSANTPQQLNNQIEKILAMEQLAIPSTDFLGNSLLIAGGENNLDDRRILNATISYANRYYFNTANEIFPTVLQSPGSDGEAPLIRTTINNGVGFVNYTGHGTPTMWQRANGTSLININDVQNNFTNAYKYPFFIGNCCMSNNFETSVCFGEALLRAEQRGAVGYIGASCYTYFEEDFQWSIGSVSTSPYSSSSYYDPNFDPNNFTYENSGLGVFDRMFHTHGESYSDWANTAGEIMFFGNMAVQLGNATWNNLMRRYYWEIYHLMGDPSYMPYRTKPQTLTCSHPDTTTATTSLTLETIPYAYAGFSQDGKLLSGGQADSEGFLTLQLLREPALGEAKLVVTAPNYAPYMSAITVVQGSTSISNPVFDQTVFEVIVKNNQLQARINAENPARATIWLVNILGQKIATIISNGAINVGQNDFYFDLSNVPRGTYICTYFNGNRQFSQKIVW